MPLKNTTTFSLSFSLPVEKSTGSTGFCEPTWTFFPHTGKCYKYYIKTTWANQDQFREAEHACRNNFDAPTFATLDLASVPDESTNIFMTTLSQGQKAWIGGHRNFSHHWIWLDGTPWTFTAWHSGQPASNEYDNSGGNGADYLAINFESEGEWTDLLPTGYADPKIEGYICQYETDYSLSLKCPEYGYNTQSVGPRDSTPNVPSWSACATVCRSKPDCKYWTWHNENFGPSTAFKCVTMKDASGKQGDCPNCISGNRECHVLILEPNFEQSNYNSCQPRTNTSNKTSNDQDKNTKLPMIDLFLDKNKRKNFQQMEKILKNIMHANFPVKEIGKNFSSLFNLLWHSNLPCHRKDNISGSEYLLKKCVWHGKKINCSKLFKPIPTDIGICCSFNHKNVMKDSEFLQLLLRKQGVKIEEDEDTHLAEIGIGRGLQVFVDQHSNRITAGSVLSASKYERGIENQKI